MRSTNRCPLKYFIKVKTIPALRKPFDKPFQLL